MSPQSKDLKDSDLSGAPNSQTLFHLVPTTGSSLGYEAFRCPQNQPFLSESRQKDPSGRFQMGFEIGYHVPATARGRVITQLGRNADIDLPDGSMSRIRHAVFEFCPKTDGIFLRDRSGQKRSVACKPTNSAPPQDVAAEEKGLLRYGQSYKLKIGPYAFDLVWYITDEAEAKEVVQKGYERSNEEAALEPVCDHPTDYIEPDKICRYPPRVKMNIDFGFDLADILRESAILAQTRAQIRNEAKILMPLKHKHVIEILGYQDVHDMPWLAMPQRHSLTALTKHALDSGLLDSEQWRNVCFKVAEHMLSTLAYLADKNIVHRDVKPGNILYSIEGKGDHTGDPGDNLLPGDVDHQFQLADFGLASYETTAATPRCGTTHYQAPELHFGNNPDDKVHHTHKSDVYSLCVTLRNMSRGLQLFASLAVPPSYQDICNVVQAWVEGDTLLTKMGDIDPAKRWSAADFLKELSRRARTRDNHRKEDEEEGERVCDIEMQDVEPRENASRYQGRSGRPQPSCPHQLGSPSRRAGSKEQPGHFASGEPLSQPVLDPEKPGSWVWEFPREFLTSPQLQVTSAEQTGS
ncbi:hypothetical protein PG988_012427 [Apiospora saccharicola]